MEMGADRDGGSGAAPEHERQHRLRARLPQALRHDGHRPPGAQRVVDDQPGARGQRCTVGATEAERVEHVGGLGDRVLHPVLRRRVPAHPGDRVDQLELAELGEAPGEPADELRAGARRHPGHPGRALRPRPRLQRRGDATHQLLVGFGVGAVEERAEHL